MNREPTILGLKLPTKFYKNVSTMSIETIDTRISDIRLELKELSDNIEFKLIREFDFKSSINEFEPMKYVLWYDGVVEYYLHPISRNARFPKHLQAHQKMPDNEQMD